MSTRLSVDREYFQDLLASAFVVQESGMDAQSLSALVQIQRSITAGKPNLDRTMEQVADRARNVADATGIAIALIQGDQLVYRAGSGSAAAYVGRHVTAILSASAHNNARGEILRVENAQTDARIESAICRQFEAESLLILPIYRERALAGVLEVFFSEAHAFEDREVRTYRSMARLVEDAMSRVTELAQKKAQAAQPMTVPHAIEQITFQMQSSPTTTNLRRSPQHKHGIGPLRGAAAAAAGELLDLGQPAEGATTITKLVRRIPLHELRWSVAVPAVVTALVIAACWIAYNLRPTAPVGTSSLQRSRPFVLTKPVPSNSVFKAQTAAGGRGEAKAPSSAFKRVRVGPYEVDYVAEDVTIRHFTPKPSLRLVLGAYREVQIGEDVTVRYFVSKPGLSQTHRR
jgi:GAF domain